MRITTLLLATATVFAASAASAQTVQIDDLRAPTSPAFVLLDVTPASVERPANPKPFALNLIHKLATSNGLPQNYALDVAPYWLSSHPGLSFDQYQRPTIGQSIAQTFSLSVATTPLPAAQSGTGTAAATGGTRLGAGIRANVWNGRPNPKLEALIDQLEGINNKILDAPAGANIDALKADAMKVTLEIQALDAQRVGFFLTVAAAQVWNYPGDNVKAAQDDRRGFWLTPAYRFRACGGGGSSCDAFFDAIGVARALRDPGKDTQWDVGGRLLWQPSKELNVSIEALRRRGVPNAAGSNRTVGMLEYRINQDMALYGSFGQDFAKDSGIQPLVSLLGLNLGFGRTPTVNAMNTTPK